MARHSPVENLVHEAPDLLASAAEGWTALAERILAAGREGRRSIGIDGYPGVDWELLVTELSKRLEPAGFRVRWLDTRQAMLSARQSAGILARCLPPGEPVFGRLFRGRLREFFDDDKLARLRDRLAAGPRGPSDGELLICCGPGALLPELARFYRLKVYVDLTREESLKRNKAWLQKRSKTQSISPRRIYYVDFPVHDRHRRGILGRADLYVDGNQAALPKLLPVASLRHLVASLTRQPLRFKPLYERGVWGGQWLKGNRKLDPGMPNCAYGYEIIAPEQSLFAVLGPIRFELPFNLFAAVAGNGLIRDRARRRFGGDFPIRFAYDDTWAGGNLSIQVHPTAAYMREKFDERMHQAEMYYIFDAKPGSIVHLGLKDGTDLERFRGEAEASEKKRQSFDHARFVNVVPARVGDILLIPPGTIHGAGAGELVLEISSTPYRYTFKIYDYCRPDLDGSFRPLHIAHAFNVIKSFRETRWVAANLIPRPRLLKSRSAAGSSWREYVIADRREFHHVVHRIEFSRYYRDHTQGKFHLLNLVEGAMVRVRPRRAPAREHLLALSETLLLPRSVGEYEVLNQGGRACKVVKSFLRHE